MKGREESGIGPISEKEAAAAVEVNERTLYDAAKGGQRRDETAAAAAAWRR